MSQPRTIGMIRVGGAGSVSYPPCPHCAVELKINPAHEVDPEHPFICPQCGRRFPRKVTP